MAEVGQAVQRLRELGAGGALRRLRWRAGAAGRAAAQARWRATAAAARRGEAAHGPSDAPEGRWGAFFLPVCDTALARSFCERYPAALETLLAQAGQALKGDLSFVVAGGNPDWHRALPGEGRWPLLPSAELEPLIGAERPLGDVRLAWEVGRCTHWVRLAQAAWLTRERRYAEAARDGFFDFVRENPPGLGIAWLHAQEAALRAVAWLFAIQLLRGARLLDPEAAALSREQLRLHGAFVEAFRSDAPVTHNHLVSEALGLLVLGTALPSLPEAARWRALGGRLLAREVRKQVYPEGPSGEGSTHYHAFVLESCLAAVALGARLPADVRQRLERMAEFVRSLIREDGSLPAIGDSDAGRTCRLGSDPRDRRDVLATAAICFERADWGAVAGDAPGAFWWTGGRPVPGAGSAPPPGGGRVLREAGLAVARTGHAAGEEIAIFRAGPTRFLPDVLVSHLHADALSVLLRAGGEDVLHDPGTYLYSEGEGWRAALRRTSSHSCVVVDGRDQADVTSQRFGIAGLAPARWLRFEASDHHLVAEAEHPAGAPERVRRRVVWLAGGTLALCDEVLGSGERTVEVCFQLGASEGEVRGGAAELRLGTGRTVRIAAWGGSPRVVRPGPDPGAGWYAPRFGERAAGTSVRVTADSARLPYRLLTLLQTAGAGERITPCAGELRPDGAARACIGSTTITFLPDGGTSIEGLAERGD